MKINPQNLKHLCLFFFLSISFLTISSCKKKGGPYYNPSAQYELGLDLQSSFLNNHVQFIVDNVNYFDGIVSTNPVLGYAGGTKLNLLSGKHTLIVVVDNEVKWSEQLLLIQNQYAAIQFDQATKFIDIKFSDHPFFYF